MKSEQLFALGTTGMALTFALAACSSSSGTTDLVVTDAAADATVVDSGNSGADAESEADSGGDTTAHDAGACVPYDASALDDAAVAAGYDFAANVFRCGQCHQSTPADAGITLSGRTTSLSDAGPIYPPNLTPDRTTGLGCWTNAQIANAILNGIDDEGATLCVMPHFGAPAADGGPAKMDAGTAAEIVAFLRSLPAVANQVPDTTCPGAADAGDQ